MTATLRKTASARKPIAPAAFDRLPKVTASALVTGMQDVTKTVLTQGAVVITKHDQPAMVLMSVERYRELEQASAPDLDALTKDFDAMYARMQAPGARKRMANAFAANPKAMGAVAVAAVEHAEAAAAALAT